MLARAAAGVEAPVVTPAPPVAGEVPVLTVPLAPAPPVLMPPTPLPGSPSGVAGSCEYVTTSKAPALQAGHHHRIATASQHLPLHIFLGWQPSTCTYLSWQAGSWGWKDWSFCVVAHAEEGAVDGGAWVRGIGEDAVCAYIHEW